MCVQGEPSVKQTHGSKEQTDELLAIGVGRISEVFCIYKLLGSKGLSAVKEWTVKEREKER